MQPETPTTAGKDPGKARRWISAGLKIGVTVVGMALVLRNLDLNLMIQIIKDTDLFWMLVGVLLMVLSLVIRAFRWHILLLGVGSSMEFSRLVELYLVGSFFNAFLPSGLGGDVVRAAEAAQDVDSSIAVSTVLFDRLTGLLALFAMALVVLPFRPDDFPQNLATAIGVICIVGLLTGIALIDGRLLWQLLHRLPAPIKTAGDDFLKRFALAVNRTSWRALGSALLVSVLFNLIQVGWWASTGKALGLSIPFSYFLLVVPIMSLALLVPSIGGLGVREYLAPALFRGAAVQPVEAVALTLLVFGLERAASLLGAPVYIYSALRAPRSARHPDGAVNGR